MCKKANYNTKKYNILKMLHKMSVDRYRHVQKQMPELLGVCKSTWENWLYYSIDDTAQIPYDKLVQISQLLNCTVKDLINYHIKQHQPLTTYEEQPPNQLSLLE
jgi:DNA-binding Xre family transcriptional regulator